MSETELKNFVRTSHTPSYDYAAMSDAELMKLRAKMLAEVEQLEKPGIIKRISKWLIKGGAAAVTFLGGMWIAENTFLKTPENKPAEKNPLTFANDLTQPLTDGQALVWSCKGCGGCPEMSGCFPAYINKADNIPDAEGKIYNPAAGEKLAKFIAAHPHHPAETLEYFRANPDTPNAMVSGIKQLLGVAVTPKSITSTDTQTVDAEIFAKRQTIFAAVASTIAGIGAIKAVESQTDAKDEKQAHHTKHDIQHIEDELSCRLQRRSGQIKQAGEQKAA
jgi:hypothetical protein